MLGVAVGTVVSVDVQVTVKVQVIVEVLVIVEVQVIVAVLVTVPCFVDVGDIVAVLAGDEGPAGEDFFVQENAMMDTTIRNGIKYFFMITPLWIHVDIIYEILSPVNLKQAAGPEQGVCLLFEGLQRGYRNFLGQSPKVAFGGLIPR
jgi:hypothetical protein